MVSMSDCKLATVLRGIYEVVVECEYEVVLVRVRVSTYINPDTDITPHCTSMIHQMYQRHPSRST